MSESKDFDKLFSYKPTLWDKITTPFYRVRNFIRDKWYNLRCRCQRFKRGYAWSDTWDMDYWFVETVKPMLEHLLKHHCGYPGDITNEEWESILKEMIECLSVMEEESAMEHLGITYDDYSLDSAKRVSELMNTNKDRFFELFSKWFYGLWD